MEKPEALRQAQLEERETVKQAVRQGSAVLLGCVCADREVTEAGRHALPITLASVAPISAGDTTT